jgi:hypothetical protein
MKGGEGMNEQAKLLFRLRQRLVNVDMAMTLSASDRFLEEVIQFVMDEIAQRGA